ncbi:MAG: hypothetical protein K9N47_02110 [Prosthecobacter sp.]|uniref:hypothetical protein n=1 Tax=Prosthecobacter sp. TaxID=1965333 RepID=UPI0025FC99F9|nr:hypothetical protein [Prosthecobacter sp.]MCF7784882.1 hypothetical protein [Prosthecobacter sp.]
MSFPFSSLESPAFSCGSVPRLIQPTAADEAVDSDQAQILIMQRDKAAATLVDLKTCDACQRLDIQENIVRGERAIEEGRVVSHDAAKNRMSRWLK